ncbi:DUF2975 domain-containing protein [Hymenobacter sp. B81]|uniref:DUF2975 domain-containing protein n=1 Tax=Hymenobacter sp. B81 TaxID=3344878 RepID=UPI0037DCCA2D
METRSQTILTTMQVVFWVIFIGLCIKTGALAVSLLVSLFVNADAARDLYMGLDLHALQTASRRHYLGVGSLLLYLWGAKAYMAYLVTAIFAKLNFEQPFSPAVGGLIAQISHAALGAGIVALLAEGYSDWLLKRGLDAPGGWAGGEFLFLAGILFVVAQVFQKGIDLQSEHELTI